MKQFHLNFDLQLMIIKMKFVNSNVCSRNIIKTNPYVSFYGKKHKKNGKNIV